jgi:putative N6-adenine-specific DNA methylase
MGHPAGLQGLYHSQAVAQHVALAVAACWRDLGVAPADSPDHSLFVRLDQDLVTLSLDSSGANLYRRGLKIHGGQAPLRETLAAAILRIAGYHPELPLIDPMCGSGSFTLEAALWAKQIPPGFHREFAFMQWPAFRPRQWQHLKTTAQKAIRTLPHPLIHASDLDPEACRRLAACVTRHHLDDAVDVQCHDFFALQPPPPRDGHPPATGLIVLNPPYGVRLTPDRRMETFYKRIGAKLADDFKGWHVALIVPSPHLIGTQPFPTTSIPLLHGGLQLTLLVGKVKH